VLANTNKIFYLLLSVRVAIDTFENVSFLSNDRAKEVKFCLIVDIVVDSVQISLGDGLHLFDNKFPRRL
jgi:hypothetical protein